MDVTEQKKDEQRKNDFIGMVSHELKTPLTSLKGYAQILHAKAKKNEDTFATNALSKVTDQVTKMTSMINGFLNLSRLESGKIHLNKTIFDMEELVREHTEEAQLITTTHEIIFKPCDPVPVFADRDKVGSVISNMISNAIKYSPHGKQVEICCNVIGNTVQISVKDQGIGISEEDVPRLFDRFYRVESNETELISGFGIGLYLSAEIVQHHHGKIWVESKVGRGSTFFFSLPTKEIF
jgi:signal transduction histidine kinase